MTDNFVCWRREGIVVGDWWLKLKATAQVFWGEGGKGKGRLQRKQMREVL